MGTMSSPWAGSHVNARWVTPASYLIVRLTRLASAIFVQISISACPRPEGAEGLESKKVEKSYMSLA
jgi:hypothetical protein